MHCQNCGDLVDNDSVSCYRRLGPVAEGIGGEPVEADLFVCAGTCECCGTYNQTESSSLADDENLFILIDYEENTSFRPHHGGGDAPC